jgi:hypothetical protein
MLIRDLHFENYVENTVFGSSLSNGPHDYKISGDSNEIDISQMGEYDLEMIDCLEVSSSQSFQVLSESGSYSNMEHYVNLRADSNLIIRSTNIFVESESFDDYVYRLVNKRSDSNIDTETLPSIPISLDNRFNVTDFGTYFTKKINCNKISTENIYIESSGSNEEPVLNINSRSAVNLQSLNILIDDSNSGSNVDIDTYLKSRLDESRYFLEIFIIPESGVDISFTFNQQADGYGFNHYWKDIVVFTYKINFKIVPTGEVPTDDTPSNNVLDEILTPQASDAPTYEYITFEFTPDTRYTLSNLEPGNFYDIYADVTNLFTNTTVYNILTDGVNIPTIKHVVIQNDGVNSIVVVNENTIKIRYTPHDTYIASWNTPDKLVYFAAKLIEPIGYTNTINQTPGSTGNTFNLSDLSIVDRNAHYLEFTLDISQFTDGTTSYGDYLKVSGDNTTKTTDPHSFSIVSTHSSGTFEMISPSVELTSFDFGPPATPTNFSMNYFATNVFNWTLSANTVATTRIENIYYNIYRNTQGSTRLNKNNLLHRNSLTKSDVNSCFQNDGGNLDSLPRGSRIGFIADTYKIQAYNVFGQKSGFATKTITALSINTPTWSVPTSANRQWTVSYSVSSNNGVYSITNSDKTPVTSYGNTSFSTVLGFRTHTVYVDVQDTAMSVRSADSSSITIVQPTITIGNDSYVTGSVRQYDFNVSINRHSYGTTTISSISNPSSITSNMSCISKTNSSVRFQITNSYPTLSIAPGSTILLSRISISFDISIIDSYGYSSAQTRHDDEIVVAFDNVYSITTIGSNRTFSLSSITPSTSLTSSISYQWYGPSGLLSGKTSNSTGQLADNGLYFGIFYCSVTFTNSKGFTRTINSNTLNSQTPSLTSGSFNFTSGASFTFSSSFTEISRRVKNPSGSVVTTYTTAGTYTLEVLLRNQYGFTKWVTVGTDTVTIPTAATFSFGTTTYNKITVTSIGYDSHGYPSEIPISITLYYSTSSFGNGNLPATSKSLTLSTSSTELTGLNPYTFYYVMIVKVYPNYATVYSSLLNHRTAALVQATAPLVHSKTTPSPVSVVNPDSIVLYWTPNGNPNGNGDATSVTYSISIDNGVSYIINDVASSTTSYTLTGSHGITANTTYNIIVKKVIVSPSGIGLNDQPSPAVPFTTTEPGITAVNLRATTADSYTVDVTNFTGDSYSVKLSLYSGSFVAVSSGESSRYSNTQTNITVGSLVLDNQRTYYLWGNIQIPPSYSNDKYLLPLNAITAPGVPTVYQNPSDPYEIYRTYGTSHSISSGNIYIQATIGTMGSYTLTATYEIWIYYLAEPSRANFGTNTLSDFPSGFSYSAADEQDPNITKVSYPANTNLIELNFVAEPTSRYYIRSAKRIGSTVISNHETLNIWIYSRGVAVIEIGRVRGIHEYNYCGLYWYPGSQRGAQNSIYTTLIFFHNLTFEADSISNKWSVIRQNTVERQSSQNFLFKIDVEYLDGSGTRRTAANYIDLVLYDSNHHFGLSMPDIPADATKIIVTSRVKHISLSKYQDVTQQVHEFNNIQNRIIPTSSNLVEFHREKNTERRGENSYNYFNFWVRFCYNNTYDDSVDYTFKMMLYNFDTVIDYYYDPILRPTVNMRQITSKFNNNYIYWGGVEYPSGQSDPVDYFNENLHLRVEFESGTPQSGNIAVQGLTVENQNHLKENTIVINGEKQILECYQIRQQTVWIILITLNSSLCLIHKNIGQIFTSATTTLLHPFHDTTLHI